MMRAKKGGIYLALHALVLFYSLSALCSKKRPPIRSRVGAGFCFTGLSF